MKDRFLNNNAFDKRRFINFIRGIAIFLMLWGHSIQYCCGAQFDFFKNWGFKIIYSFHMPFFMLISGYLFFFSAQKRDTIELVKHKVNSLLYPILMCSALNLLLTKGIRVAYKGNITSIFGGTDLTSLWFLWSVLACSIVVAVAVKSFKNIFVQGLLIIVGIGFVAILPCWDMNIYMYPYFVIGYIYARNEEKLSKTFTLFSIISLVLFVVMLFLFENKHYIYTSGLLGENSLLDSIKTDMFRWAIGLFGSVSVIWICKIVFKTINHLKTIKCIELLGKNSLAVYALSVSLLSFWLPRFADKTLSIITGINWNNYIWLYNLIVTPIIAIAYSIILLLIIKLLKKAKVYPFIFGKI